MAQQPEYRRGAVVTCHHPDDPGTSRAVVVDDGITDPETGITWVPAVLPDGDRTLVDPDLVDRCGPEPVAVLAEAVSALAQHLSTVDDVESARALYSRFVTAVRPVEYDLWLAVDADPDGPVAIALDGLDAAAGEFDRGDLAEGRLAVLVARATLTAPD
jgi:hypothetical protein